MKQVLLILALALGVLVACGEKCPIEPYRDTCGDLYGTLYPPEGARLPLTEFTIRGITGSCRLHCDLSFCLPGLPGDGSGAIVAALNDTLPVMVGYFLPPREYDLDVDVEPLPPDRELRNIVTDPGGGIRISGSSTALALVMMSPFLGGAPPEERYRFALYVTRHEEFDELTAGVCAALVESPEDVFDQEANPQVFEQATRILSDVIYLEKARLGVQGGRAPYVVDGSRDFIDIINPTTLNYGVRVAGEGATSPDSVFVVPGCMIDALVARWPVTVSPYPLGSGRFDIEFYKGFGGFSQVHLLDPGHAGGLATRANAEGTLWHALTAAVEWPRPPDPGRRGIADSAWVVRLAEAIEMADIGKVLDLAMDYLCLNPGVTGHWLGAPIVEPLETQRYLSAVRGILAANMAQLESAGLAGQMPYYMDLLTAAYHESLLVCQRDGSIVPCENAPWLTGGMVSPIFGYPDTVFTYTVDYYDPEGQSPASMIVVIDGEAHDMTLCEGTEAGGTYCYSTTLAIGLHTYYFEGVDTQGYAGRLPAEGVLKGPEVGGYPHLTNGGVLPVDGFTRDVFFYSVSYYDLDGDTPYFLRVVIDGEAHEMGLWSGEAHDGVYAYQTQLSAGCHDYYFEGADTTGAPVRLPITGRFEGPCVVYAPELKNGRVAPVVGTTVTDFTFEVDYLDLDGNPPLIVEVRIDDIGYTMSHESGTPSDGTYARKIRLGLGSHAYRFSSMSQTGVVSVLPDSGTFSGPMVYSPTGKNPDAKIAVHARAHSAKAGCDYGTIEGCSDIVTSVPNLSVDAFPVFFDLVEYQAVEYGLTWPDWTYSAAWFSCTDQAIGEIRRPDDGVTQIWNECQSKAVAVPGYIWLYADGPGQVCPNAHPSSGGVRVFDCSGGADWAIWPFCAGVYGATGVDPCGPYPDPGG